MQKVLETIVYFGFDRFWIADTRTSGLEMGVSSLPCPFATDYW